MLKREKKRANDAAQLANVTEGQIPVSQNGSSKAMGEGSTDILSSDRGIQAFQYMKRGPRLSLGKQEAFETFIRDHEDHVAIENNKSLLKQRSAEAKTLGEQLNKARTTITELKKRLAIRGKQRAVHVAVMGNHKESEEEVDLMEENLRKHIEQEKKVYNSIIGQLKSLKTEIEHLQLLLEKAKVKLQKDFDKWWNQETISVQESVPEVTGRHPTELASETLQPSSPSTPGYGSPGLSNTVSNHPSGGDLSPDSVPSFVRDVRFVPKSGPPSIPVMPWHGRLLDEKGTDFTPSSEWKALSSTRLTSSPIPLTGDKQSDADILAFVNARQNLLKRTGSTN